MLANSWKGSHTSYPPGGLGVFSGGIDNGEIDLPGLLLFNASDPQNLEWVNKSVPSSFSSMGPHRGGAAVAHPPVSDEGVVLYIGGFNVSCETERHLEAFR